MMFCFFKTKKSVTEVDVSRRIGDKETVTTVQQNQSCDNVYKVEIDTTIIENKGTDFMFIIVLYYFTLFKHKIKQNKRGKIYYYIIGLVKRTHLTLLLKTAV